MKVYDTLSRKIREFAPQGKRVIMYICGLTPYDHAHIGHTRTYIAFDVIKRYLTAKGYHVFHIQNITDVDDKIIKRCKETGADPGRLTREIHDSALELFDKLGIVRADIYPKVTEHIKDIIALIKKLEERGYAYETKTGVYFDVSKFPEYGALSGQRIDEIKAGARIEVDESKASPADFALWKKSNGELLEWQSPWGNGRPGWHIECSALALKYGGKTIDIHGGARDLIFPHHENEKAQSEAATGQPFCRYWLHTGFLTVGGEKMSKSLGNFVTLKDAIAKFDVNALRLFFLRTHYRSPVDYNETAIKEEEESVERIFNSLGLIDEELDVKPDGPDERFREESNVLIEKFYAAMDNDFDTPTALAAFFSLLRAANAHLSKDKIDKRQLRLIKEEALRMLDIFGIKKREISIETKFSELKKLGKEFGVSGERGTEIMERLIEKRESARKNRDFRLSDEIRRRLREIGIMLEDTEKGVRWKVK